MIVRVVLGVLLLAAASAKLYGINVTPVSRVGWLAQPFVQALAAEWEFVLGFWLLVGWYPVRAWFAAVATFLIFAGISGYLGWTGVASCGCFGTIKASPWAAFAVDIFVVVILFSVRPLLDLNVAELRRIGLSLRHSSSATVVLCGLGIIALLAVWGTLQYGSIDAALARLDGNDLSLEEPFVDFGRGKVGQVVERRAIIHNWTDLPVRIVGGTSDCSCVVASALPIEVSPSGQATVAIHMRIPPSPAGTLTRHAEFWTDCGTMRTIKFSVSCRIEQ